MGFFFSDFVTTSDGIWLLATDYNLLCYLDKSTHKLIYKDIASKHSQACEYIRLVSHQKKLYALPNNANNFLVYDITTEKSKCFECDFSDKEMGGKTSSGFFYRDNLYIIGESLKEIIKVNLETHKQKRIPVLINYTMSKRACLIDGDLFIPSMETTEILVFHIDSDTYEIHNMDIPSRGIADIEFYDGRIFFIPTDYCGVYEMELATYTAKEIIRIHDSFQADYNNINSIPYECLKKQNDAFWLFPRMSNRILKISKDMKNYECAYEFSDEEKVRYLEIGVWDDNHLFGFYSYGKCLDILDTRTGTLKRLVNEFPDNMEGFWNKRLQSSVFPLYENQRMMNLNTFIMGICKDQHSIRDDEYDFNIGARIYNKVGRGRQDA